MLEILRRVILGLAWSACIAITWWTIDSSLSVRVLEASQVVASPLPVLTVSGNAWRDLEDALRAEVGRQKRDESLRARLPDATRSLLDSTLQLPASRFAFFYGGQEQPWKDLHAQLQAHPEQPVIVKNADDRSPGLQVTWHPHPVAANTPTDLLYPYYRSSLSFWVLLAGIVLYFLLGRWSPPDRNTTVPLDTRLAKSQMLLGLALVGGFTWALLLRADPAEALFYPTSWRLGAAWLGVLTGFLILISAGRRAAHRLLLAETALNVVYAGQTRSLAPSEALALLPGTKKTESLLYWAGRFYPLRFTKSQRERLQTLLAQYAPASLAPLPAFNPLLRRWLPGLAMVVPAFVLIGFLRGGLGFFVGLQGMILGLSAGATLAYFHRLDSPEDRRVWHVTIAALGVTLLYPLAQLIGVALALPDGDALNWLSGLLNGSIHEQMWGFSRYRWHFLNLRPGPVAWVLFNLLDLLFLFVFSFLMLRVNLPWRDPQMEVSPEDSPPSVS